jgi:L-amino acid N-acyltransferase YncA
MIRPARPEDHEAFTRLFPELRVDDPTPSFEKWCAELVPTTLVAEEHGVVIGYAWFQAFAEEGLVRNIVVAPSHQGRAIGRSLLLDVAERLRALGLRRWALNVKPDNAPALALYRRLGFVETYRSVALSFDWALVDTLPPTPFIAEPIAPSDDEQAEVDQRLPRGSLARHRAMKGRMLQCVRVGAHVAGAAVFVPSFPGAYPFRADDLAVARALLLGLRPHATAPVMKTVIEGQPALAEGLLRHGAEVRLEILHLEAALPG